MNCLIELVRKHNSIAKFLIIGVSASAVHGVISWIFYYHIWGGHTIYSTLMGYTGGWGVSYIGNRLWSFRWQAKEAGILVSTFRFIICQLVAMSVLLCGTWLVQQLIILYFWWYIITNKLALTCELEQFSAGASYPPALLFGMSLAAITSYIMMKKYVFSK